MSKTDLFIVGGGPAGLAAAIAARRRGFDVTVSDGIVPPADKACGEGLMPDALRALAELGVSLGAADSFPFHGIRFHDRGLGIAGNFPSGTGRGVRRTALHRLLADHAEALGVKLRWNSHVDLDQLRCGWIIGADGERSAVRRWAGLDTRLHDQHRFGFRRHYRVEPWSDYMELYWGDRYQVYVTPVSADSVCVAVISRNSQLRLDDALRGFPELARRLKPEAILTVERGAVTSSRKLKAVYRNRVALVGDASGSVDAITGEGLCLAFRQASALAEALERGDLAAYQREHRRIARRPAWMGKLLVGLGDHPVLRHGVLKAMASRPAIFDRLLSIHVGTSHEKTRTHSAAVRDGGFWTGDSGRTRPRADERPVHAE